MLSKVYLYLGGSWVDVSSSVLASPGVSCKTGIPGNKETDRVAGNGQLTFTLKNNDEAYTPGSGTAHADWKKGTWVKVEFTKVVTKVKFIGKVNKINLQYAYNNKRAAVTALDWMYFASQLPLDIPALQTNQKGNEIISTILGFSPIQPIATELQTGTSTFPYAFHDNTVKTTAYSEITKAVMSEWGMSYLRQDGTLVFEAYGGRENTQVEVNVFTEQSGELLLEDGTALLLEDGTELLLEEYSIHPENATAETIGDIDIEYGERMINRAVVQVFPYQPGEEDVLVYKKEKSQPIAAGTTLSYRIQFTDESSKQPIAAINPTVKQYTLLHLDVPPDGVSGIIDEADQTVTYQATTFERGGGATVSTSIKKFGTGSYVGNGSSDYIYSPTREKYNFRAGDFTVDWWEYRLTATAGRAMVSRSGTAAFSPFIFGYSDGTTARAYLTSDGASWDIANNKSMGTITLNTWVHYEITRSGNTFRTFKGGVQQDTWTSSATVLPTTDDLSIFRYGGTFYLEGYIDEFRMIKGYAAHTADFTPATSQHLMSGINYSLFTTEPDGTPELTEYATVTTSAGGAGLDVSVTNGSSSDGFFNLAVFARPLESLSPISSIAEDTTSINAYGYFNTNIDMRLRQDAVFAETIAGGLVASEKDPREVLNTASLVANKNDVNEALFMDCDIGNLVRVTDSLSGYDELNHIQQISWRTIPGDGGAVVFFDWLVKEQ